MVDRQMEAADLALELTEEARRRGVADQDDVTDFEQTSREIYGDAKDRRDYWYKMGGFEPSELHDDELLPVASELFERGECERALPFYRQAIDLEEETPTEDWLDFGRCLEAVGEDDEARHLYQQIVDRSDEVDETLVLSAYSGLVMVASDESVGEWFEEAREWADASGMEWPWGYASQEAVLERALQLDDSELATHVADVISSREGVVSREGREMIDEVRERY
jgi:tetratricopeptide (TPR) repeat protein